LSSSVRQTSTLQFTLKDLKANRDSQAVKAQLDDLLQIKDEHQTTLSMTEKDAKATVTYSVTNLDKTTVEPVQITAKLKGYLDTKSTGAVNALSSAGKINTCCQSSTSVATVVEENAKAVAKVETGPVKVDVTTGKPTTNETTKEKTATGASPTILQGHMTSEVTLPAGVTVDSYIADPKVVAGYQKGIATHLGVTESYVAVTLSKARRLSAGARVLSEKAKVKAEYTITIPASDSAMATAASTKLAASDVADKLSTSATDAVRAETGNNDYGVVISAVTPKVTKEQDPASPTPGTGTDKAGDTSSAQSTTALLGAVTVLSYIASCN
jgi:hypothetical protein